MNIERIEQPNLDHQVTPFFRHQSIENVPQSEIQKRPIMEVHEVVELRFAGDKNYAPVLPVDAMYRREGHTVITYAERFAKQYRQFKEGEAQTADGTPLDVLAPLGITPNQISMCRVNNVHSVEALCNLSEKGVRQLGNSANFLREIAAQYMAERRDAVSSAAEIERLRRELEELKAANVVPTVESTPAEKDEAVARVNDEFDAMTDEELKQFIADKGGQGKPRGPASRSTLLTMAREVA